MKERKIIAVVLMIFMLSAMILPSSAAVTFHTEEATKLQKLGLMAGGLADQRLEERMTRLQGLIFAIKAAGKAKEVELITDQQVTTELSRFTDAASIPTYGKKYMTYAIQKKITSGVGNNKLGALDPISGTSFLVFLLKTGMGYSGANTGNIINMAHEAGVITFDQKAVYATKPALLRDDAATILYKAVMDGINDDGIKFIESLIASGFVSREAFNGMDTPSDITSGSLLTVEQIAKNSAQVVLLKRNNAAGDTVAFGSGFFISRDGHIVTNYHVVDGAASMTATMQDGQVFNIESVLAYDAQKDLAVLKATGVKLDKALILGDSSSVAIGQDVVAIGNPEGLTNTVSTGIISSIRFNNERNANDFQISAPTSKGSSGGPLFNMKGVVIGINYAGYIEGQNLNFSIPIADLKPLLANLNPKTFAQVQSEVASSTKTIEGTPPNMETLSNMMYTQYNTIVINGKPILVSNYVTDFVTNKPSTILHMVFITDQQSMINYYECLADPKLKSELVTLLYQAMKKVASYYPSYNQIGIVDVVFEFPYYPSGIFDDIFYNPDTGYWEASDYSLCFLREGGIYSTYIP